MRRSRLTFLPTLFCLLLILTLAPELRCQNHQSKPVYNRPLLGHYGQQQQQWQQQQWIAQRPSAAVKNNNPSDSHHHHQQQQQSWQHFRWPQPNQQQQATMPWEFVQPRKGLHRLLEEFATAGGHGEGGNRNGQQPQLSPDMNRPPLATNLERYMPLLAKQRPKAKNGTGKGGQHHLIDSREPLPLEHWRPVGAEEAEDEEEDSLEEANGSPGEQQQPCVTANCRTWITITIPSELVGIPPGIGLPAPPPPQQKPDSPATKTKPLPGDANASGKPMPPFPPQPMPNSRSRGQPSSAKNRPASQSTPIPQNSTSVAPSPTTSVYPPDFVFSTKWILPVNGVSLRPANTTTSSSPTATTSSPITTATTGASGGSPWGQRPFTMRPRAKLPSPSAIATSSPLPVPRERPPIAAKAGPRPAKPWTHAAGGPKAKERPVLGSSSREKESKTMPRPPTPDTTIEQAAIWASTELIDAIREALAKFRASLNRNAQMAAAQDETADPAIGGGEEQQAEAERLLHAQLQAAWDSLRGTWLEQAVAELAQQADALGGGGHQRFAEMFLPMDMDRHNNNQSNGNGQQQQPMTAADDGHGHWQRRRQQQQQQQH